MRREEPQLGHRTVVTLEAVPHTSQAKILLRNLTSISSSRVYRTQGLEGLPWAKLSK